MTIPRRTLFGTLAAAWLSRGKPARANRTLTLKLDQARLEYFRAELRRLQTDGVAAMQSYDARVAAANQTFTASRMASSVMVPRPEALAGSMFSAESKTFPISSLVSTPLDTKAVLSAMNSAVNTCPCCNAGGSSLLIESPLAVVTATRVDGVEAAGNPGGLHPSEKGCAPVLEHRGRLSSTRDYSLLRVRLHAQKHEGTRT